jgi:hypothetical protein
MSRMSDTLALTPNELKVCHQLRDLGEMTLLLVVSAVDNGVYGPFLTRRDAFEFASNSDGSTFECRARLISAREI